MTLYLLAISKLIVGSECNGENPSSCYKTLIARVIWIAEEGRPKQQQQPEVSDDRKEIDTRKERSYVDTKIYVNEFYSIIITYLQSLILISIKYLSFQQKYNW